MKVNSSMIDEIFEWQEVNGQGQFDVKFPNGKIYRYFNVPRGVYDKLLSSESIGKFFDLYIKKAGYKYEEITAIREKSPSIDPRITEAFRLLFYGIPNSVLPLEIKEKISEVLKSE